MRRWRFRLRSESGQIVIPALFMFPTLMLFVFLLFETAKVSRYKIRHQFAVDAAAFVEMTNYSDFLNRSAYVNGAFPMRIFREGFHDTFEDTRGHDPTDPPGYYTNGQGGSYVDDLMYHDGAFPRYDQNPDQVPQGSQSWDISFSGGRSGMNDPDSPDVSSHDMGYDGSGTNACSGTCTLIFTNYTASHFNIGWDDGNQVLKLYVQIYQLLGSVEAAQFAVLKRLADKHNFLSKSYYLNIGEQQAIQEAGQAVQDFRVSADPFVGAVNFWCTPKMRLYAQKPAHELAQAMTVGAADAQMPPTIDCVGRGGNQGLFQLVTIDRNVLNSMSQPSPSSQWSKGWPVSVHWTVPNNYFGVDLNSMLQASDNGGPKVRASVAIYRGAVNCQGANCPANIWPSPTPKFQVRLYP